MTNPDEIREKLRQAWDSVADEWKSHSETLEQFARPATDKMLAFALIEPGMDLLDAACGAGEPGLSALEMIGGNGSLTGTDFSESMIRAAERNAQERGLKNARFLTAPLEALPFEDASFDRVLCRCGLMFSPEPQKAASEFKRVLKPGGKAVGVVWAERQRNPWSGIALDVLDKLAPSPPQPGLPGAFVLGTEEKLSEVLRAGGFESIQIDCAFHVSPHTSAGDQWHQMLTTAGPFRRAFDRLSPEDRAFAEQEILAGYQRELESGGIKGVSLVFCASV